MQTDPQAGSTSPEHMPSRTAPPSLYPLAAGELPKGKKSLSVSTLRSAPAGIPGLLHPARLPISRGHWVKPCLFSACEQFWEHKQALTAAAAASTMPAASQTNVLPDQLPVLLREIEA